MNRAIGTMVIPVLLLVTGSTAYRHGLLDVLSDSLSKVTLFQCQDASSSPEKSTSTPIPGKTVSMSENSGAVTAEIIDKGYCDGIRLATDSNKDHVYRTKGSYRVYWTAVTFESTADEAYLDLKQVQLKTESDETYPVFGLGRSTVKGRFTHRFGCSSSMGVNREKTYPAFDVGSSSGQDQAIIDVAYPVIGYCSDEAYVETSGTIGIEGSGVGNIDIEVSDDYSRVKFLKTPSALNLVFIVPAEAGELKLVGLTGTTEP